jgi:hypothetical protein
VTINKDDTYLYSGLLKEYVLTKDDVLDRVYLTNLQMRKLVIEQSKETEEDLDLRAEPEEVIDYDIDFEDIEPDDEMIKQLEEMEKEVADDWYYMPGDYFVIPYSEIKNINISYYKEENLEPKTDENP